MRAARRVPTPPASETRLRAAAPTEGELVSRAVAGDPAAFGELARRHRPSVYLVAVRLLGHAQDAEDVTQETFARVFGKLPPSLTTEACFVRYVRTVARHLCADRRRGRAARIRFVDVDETELATDLPPADVLLEQRERRGEVEALRPAVRRVIFALLDGLSRAEVATALGITESAIHQHVRHATEVLAGSYKSPRARLTYKGRSGSLDDFAALAKVSRSALRYRLRRGMTLAAAIETPRTK